MTCSWDQTAKLWNTADHSLLQTLAAQAGVTHCALSPDGKLAALGVENTLQIWEVESGKQIGICEGHKGKLIDVAFSPDGATIATSAHSEPARVWNTASGEMVGTLGDQSHPASTVIFSHDGKSIATGEVGNVCLWDASTYDLQQTISLGNSPASRLSFSPDNDRLAVAAEAVYVLDPRAGVPLLRFQPNDDTIYFVSFSPDGSKLASCTTGGSIAVSGINFAPTPPASTIGVDGSIETAAIVYSGRRGGSQNLYVLDLAAGTTSKLTDIQEKGRGANNPRLSLDHQRLAFQFTQPGNYDIHVMPVAGGESRALVEHPAYDVSPVWSPGGDQIAFMSTRGFELGSIGPFPGHIYIIDADGQHLRQVTQRPLTSSLGPSDWSTDGRTLLIARVSHDQTDVYELDVATGAERALTNSDTNESSAVFSHDGKQIAYHAESDQGSDIVACRADGSEPVTLTSAGFNYYPRWSPDDQWIIFTSSEGEQCDISAVRVADKKVIPLVVTPEDEREGAWVR